MTTMKLKEINSKQSCDICGDTYKAKTFWQKHCSQRCRLAAWAIRRAKLKGKKKSK